MRRSVAVPLVAAVVSAGALALARPADAATVSTPGGYVAVVPKRIVDTRTGLNAPKAAIRAGQTFTSAILGHGGLPGSGVAAVQVTITVLSPTAAGGITAFGATAPGTTNVQFNAKQTVSNSAIVPVSGSVIRFEDAQSTGSAQVVIDLQGYYRSGTPTQTGAYHSLSTPIRAVDTRSGVGLAAKAALGAGQVVVATPRGAGLPASGVGAVAVTVTVAGPTRPGAIVAWPTGTPRPGPATLNFPAGRGLSAFGVVALSGGRMDLYNSATAAVNVIVDVVGYYAAGAPAAAGTFGALAGNRVLVSSVGAGATIGARVTGGGVPRPAGTVALVSVTVIGPTRAGGLTAWQSATPRPGVTTLQFAAGQQVLATTAVPISSSGYVNIYNGSSGSATVVVDVHGYTAQTTLTVPTTSRGRYPNDLAATPDVSGNPGLMHTHGCDDAHAGSSFVLLDIGAQSLSAPTLGPAYNDRGVVLTPTATRVPLKYADLVSAVDGYLAGYASCAPTTTAIVAVGTNNDGAFDPTDTSTYYSPQLRGSDWAAWVNRIKADAASLAPRVTVTGAIDIEAGFASTQAQAQAWETAYLAATPALSLIYNGDANDCPTTFGVHGATCAYGWTQAQYYAMAHNGSRIQVLPQIYYPAEAVKWADIDATGGGGLIFAGALTESGDPGTNAPAGGWTYLYRALSSLTASPNMPRLVDIAPDS